PATERAPADTHDAGVSDAAAARPGAAPDAEVAIDRTERGNTGTCAVMVLVALAQARHEAVSGSHPGAAHCPDHIMHGVVLAPGAAPQTGEVSLNDAMTLERLHAHEREVCAYQAMIGCP